jgi:hypothetical protein
MVVEAMQQAFGSGRLARYDPVMVTQLRRPTTGAMLWALAAKLETRESQAAAVVRRRYAPPPDRWYAGRHPIKVDQFIVRWLSDRCRLTISFHLSLKVVQFGLESVYRLQ